MTALTTPVADGTDIGEIVGGKLYGRNLLNDTTGADAMGTVTANPTANTLLARLKDITDAVTTMDGHVDGIEALLTTLNGLVDGLEGGQATGNASLASIAGYLDTVETLLAAATPAGENYTGKVGGDVYSVSATPVVSATPDYSTGDAVGAVMTFTNAVRVNGGSGIVQGVSIFSKVANSVQMDLLLFNASPTAPTDNGAFDLQAGDYTKLIGVIPVTEWTSLGTAPSIGQNIGRGQPIKAGGGTTSIYGVLVVRGTLNLASTSDIVVTLNIIPG